MKLIFLYGPPAVGKLTIGKELAAITEFRLFHNHLSIDLVTAIFDRGSEPYYRLVRQIRYMMLEEAAKANVPGLIMTFVYAPSRRAIVRRYEEIIEKHGGEFCFVRLYCDPAILAQRVVHEDRRQHGKIIGVERLHEVLQTLEQPFAPVADRESLSLDVGKLDAVQAAQVIQKHYNLF